MSLTVTGKSKMIVVRKTSVTAIGYWVISFIYSGKWFLDRLCCEYVHVFWSMCITGWAADVF